MIDTQDQTATYECFGVIGNGSVTTIYDGYDHLLKREVAIKELRPEFRHDEEVARAFWGEATLLAGLNHANILRIYGIDRDRCWIVMEPMQGSLASEAQAAKLPISRVRDLLKQILEGLRYLHAMDRVHGQIRLDSLLVDALGNIKLSNLSDFEVGGEFRSPDGKQLHNAPEVLNPRHFGQPGLTTDLYCVGIVALQLLAGDKFIKLFKGLDRKRQSDPIAWSAWHASSEAIAPIQSIIADLPADLIALVEGLTQKQVGLRFATAAEAVGTISPSLFSTSQTNSPASNISMNPSVDAGQVPECDTAVTYNSPSLYSPRSATVIKKPALSWRRLLQEVKSRLPVLFQRKTLMSASGLLVGFLFLLISLSPKDTETIVEAKAEDVGGIGSGQAAQGSAADNVAQVAPPKAFVESGAVKFVLTDDRKQSVDVSQAILLINGEELGKPEQADDGSGDNEFDADSLAHAWRILDNSYSLIRASQSAPFVLSGPAGPLDLEVRLNGYQTCVKSIAIVANQEDFCRIELARQAYDVQFKIQPASANLLIDGQAYAQGTSLRSAHLPLGKHHVKVTAEDYQDSELWLEVKGQSSQSIQLVRLPLHTLTIDSYPQGALVEIDGKAIGRTPVPWTGIEGKHRIKLELNGFTTVSDRFSVTDKSSRLLWYFDNETHLLAQRRSAD